MCSYMIEATAVPHRFGSYRGMLLRLPRIRVLLTEQTGAPGTIGMDEAASRITLLVGASLVAPVCTSREDCGGCRLCRTLMRVGAAA